MAKLSDLPDDVIAKICSLLAAKSVLRLKSVQKSWNVLITALTKTPSFVADHLYNSTNNRPTSSSFIFESSYRKRGSGISDKDLTLLTLHYKNKNKNKNKNNDYDKDKDNDDDNVKVELSQVPDQINALVERSKVVLTHCDGVVCLVDPYATAIEVRNPATGQLRLIPSPGFSNKPPAWVNDLFAGFGYDAVSRAYKIVVGYLQWRAADFVVKVCTVGEDTWRQVEISTTMKLSGSDVGFTGPGLCCGGVCYWVSSMKVLCFDMHSETFDAVPLPQVFCEYWGWVPPPKLLRLGDSIALYRDPPPTLSKAKASRTGSVWVMSHKDKHWTEQYKLDKIGKVRGFSKSGHEILMLGRPRADRGLISYNVDHNKRRRICLDKTIHDALLIPYVDSFLAL